MPEEKMFIFPEKHSLTSAVALCKAHGGYLFTPRNQQKNEELHEQLAAYQSDCLDEASGNIAWMGATTKNFDVMINDLKKNLVQVNYTNWKYPPFAKDNKCTYMNMDGKWLAHHSCLFKELCPVCGFVGTPIFTLKGKQKLIPTIQILILLKFDDHSVI